MPEDFQDHRIKGKGRV